MDTENQVRLIDLNQKTWEDNAILTLKVLRYLASWSGDVAFAKHVFDITKSIAAGKFAEAVVRQADDLVVNFNKSDVVKKSISDLDKEIKLNIASNSKIVDDLSYETYLNRTELKKYINNELNFTSFNATEGKKAYINGHEINLLASPKLVCGTKKEMYNSLNQSLSEFDEKYRINDKVCYQEQYQDHVSKYDLEQKFNNSELKKITDQLHAIIVSQENADPQTIDSNNIARTMEIKADRIINKLDSFLEDLYHNIENSSKKMQSEIEKKFLDKANLINDKYVKYIKEFQSDTEKMKNDFLNKTKDLNTKKEKALEPVKDREASAAAVNAMLYYSVMTSIAFATVSYMLQQNKIRKLTDTQTVGTFIKDALKGIGIGSIMAGVNHLCHEGSKLMLDSLFNYQNSNMKKDFHISDDSYNKSLEGFAKVIVPLIIYEVAIKYGMPVVNKAFEAASGIWDEKSQDKILERTNGESTMQKIEEDVSKIAKKNFELKPITKLIPKCAKPNTKSFLDVICCKSNWKKRRGNEVSFQKLQELQKLNQNEQNTNTI